MAGSCLPLAGVAERAGVENKTMTAARPRVDRQQTQGGTVIRLKPTFSTVFSHQNLRKPLIIIYNIYPSCIMHSNNHYNKILKYRANSLRKDMTKSEACLWKYVLSSGQMKGYTFRRQRPVLNYIADFYCQPLKLIIEVDGITHDDEHAVEYDRKRDNDLTMAGFVVLRFSASDVLRRITMVGEVIEDWIDKWEKKNLK